MGVSVRRIALAALGAAVPGLALAHGSDAGIVLLLPTGYYILGAAFAVAASFALVSLLPDRATRGLFSARIATPPFRAPSGDVTSVLVFLGLALFVAAGFFGSRDPLRNPLPAVIWTAWWVCFTILCGLLGPLWQWLNPWRGPLAVVRRLTASRLGARPLVELSARLGYGAAILQFYAFAWFELVDLAPSDPQRLAAVVSLYWLTNMLAMIVFGERAWTERGEPFSIFFRLIGAAAPLSWRRQADGRVQIGLGWFGTWLRDLAPLPPSGVLFVLLTLSTVSFDGLSRSFAWLAAVGINPLDFPGRSAVVASSSLGILLMFAALTVLFFGCVWLGQWMAGGAGAADAAGRLVYSIIPISLAFQFAHYLTEALVELQNLSIALSDPFALGWDLLGTADDRVTTSFLNVFETVRLIFSAQVIAIAFGHIVAVVLAHALIMEITPTRKRALMAELPLAALMVFYTAFGLWLLSTPRI